MNKYQLYMLGGELLATTLLSACASNGQFASKGNPIDYGVSLQRTCTGLRGLDLAFKGVAPGLIASGKMTEYDAHIEADAFKLLNNACDHDHPPTDLPGAIALVAVASVDMGNLIAHLTDRNGS